MPCVAKKFEIGRDDEDASGYPDVDIVITTRELGRMIQRAGIKFTALENEEYDSPLSEDTGAAVIFGATGGVMEAALRTANDWLTGKDNRTVEITYEHSTSTDENCFYSHSQKTSVTLPADADEETIKAYFDDNDNVVVSVKKKSKEPEKKGPRSIPVGVRHNDK